jgi:hypothetical protein
MAKILIGRVLDQTTDSVTSAQGDAGTDPWLVRGMNKMVPVEFDFIDITSRNVAGDPLVIVYKTGGSGGTTVATLTLTYDVGGDLKTVTRT